MSRVSTIQWTMFTALGLATGLVAGVLLGMPLGQIVNAMIVTAAVTCIAGAILGGFQAISLRRVLRRPIWWIVATVIGLGVGLAAAVVTIEQTAILLTGHRPQLAHLTTFYRAISFIALGLVAGTILGIAQSLVLRRQLPAVKQWVPSTAIGLAIALSASSLAVDLSGLRVPTAMGAIAFVILSGFAFGALTSRPLRRAAHN
jgi:hypothetical protein